MSGPIDIRPCAEADWPRVLELLGSVFVGEGFVSRERHERGCRREALEAGGLVLTGVEGGVVLGAVVLAHPGGPLNLLAGPGEAEFRMLAVAPAARGRGVGRRLVQECGERARGAPWAARRLVLWTQPGMVAAQRLYEGLGFVRVPARDKQMPPGSEGWSGPVTRERWAYELALGG